MKFSLLYEMQISEPDREREHQTFRDAVEQVVLADSLGFHAVWEVEHHGLYEYSHSSAPEIFLAFVAAKTKQIRIGHGVTLTPSRYNHPIRIAERIATLDILSGGRVNWGSGKSAAQTEQNAFECDPMKLHAQWAEALKMIPRMWQDEIFSFKGEFYHVPPTRIIPKPVQQPHPPMYAACTKPDSAAAVGALGLGALNFAVGNDEYLTQKIAEYRKAVASANPQGYVKTDHFACAPPSIVLPDDREACRHGFRGARFFLESLSHYYLRGAPPTGKLDVQRGFMTDSELERAMAQRTSPTGQMNVVIGGPEQAIAQVERFRRAGVDELILVMQMGTVPHEIVMESIRTVGQKVIPHFAK